MKYRKKRTSRLVTNTTYVAKQGLNVSPSTRYFAPLPYKMDVRTDWMADTRYEFVLGGGVNNQPRTENMYVFLDPLNMTNPVNNQAYNNMGNRYFWSADMGAMLALYQEAVFRTHVLNMDLAADYTKAVTAGTGAQPMASTTEPSVLVACAQVPLTYIRRTDGALQTIANAGIPQQGVDYYSALTQSPGAKSGVVGWGQGATTWKSRLTIDGYAHNGVQQTITSSMAWDPAAQGNTPVVTHAYPNPGQRNVFLIAIRVRYNPVADITQTVHVRASFKLEQHLVLQDKYPAFPYILGLGACA
jgi:hypothetical protein